MPSEEYLGIIIKGLVQYPEEVTIERTVDEMGVLLSVKVNPYDMGKVIGKEGSTAKSVRNIMNAMAHKNREKVNVKIIEPVR